MCSTYGLLSYSNTTCFIYDIFLYFKIIFKYFLLVLIHIKLIQSYLFMEILRKFLFDLYFLFLLLLNNDSHKQWLYIFFFFWHMTHFFIIICTDMLYYIYSLENHLQNHMISIKWNYCSFFFFIFKWILNRFHCLMAVCLSVRSFDWLSASLIVDLSAEKTSVKCYQLIYINFNDKA